MSENTKETKKKSNTGVYILVLIIGLILMSLLIYLILVIKSAKNGTEPVQTGVVSDDNKKIYTQSQLNDSVNAAVEAALAEAEPKAAQEGRRVILDNLKLGLSLGNKVLDTIRPFYPNELVLVSNGAYHFIPIRDDLKKNSLDKENLVRLESGELQYFEGQEKISHKGIDVSKFQGKIDWEKVAADGVEFAFVRVGYRGYGSTGKLVEDDTAETNINGAIAAGIKTGVYFYTQAISKEEMQEEIDILLNRIQGKDIRLPVVIDVEKVSPADGRMNSLNAEDRTELVKYFCEKIAQAGYKPMIYHNMEMGVLMLNLEELEQYDKWFAYYNGDIYYPYAHKVWQYSPEGRVDGIDGDVDMNISFSAFWEE